MNLKTQVGLRLPHHLHKQVKEAAAKRGISMSDFITEALTEAVAEDGKQLSLEEQAREIAKYLAKEIGIGSF